MNKKLLLVASLVCLNIATFLHSDPISGSTPTISRIYADRFTDEVAQSQSLGLVGTLDSTFGAGGILDLSPQGSGRRGNVLAVDQDGSVFVGLSTHPETYTSLVKYKATGEVDTTFGTAGIVILDDASIDGDFTSMAHGMMIDQRGRILVSGCNEGSGNRGWLKRVSADGSTIETFINSVPWQFVGAVASQTSGKTIALGQVYVDLYTQLARYNFDGSLDTTFGTNGYVVFDGTGGLPQSLTILYSLVITQDDSIYIPYIVGTSTYVAKFNVNGALDTSWGTGGSVAVPYLDNATTSQIHIAQDADGNLILGAQVGSALKVTGITSSGGVIPGFSNYLLSDANTYAVHLVLTTTDGTSGKILLVGSNVTTIQGQIISLNSDGSLDLFFNFSVGTPDTTCDLLDIALAPDGKIYAPGYQTDNSVTTPYLARLYNVPGTYQVAQYPAEKAQGDINLSFGGSDMNTGDGVVRSYNGYYGANLQQVTNAIIELPFAGDYQGTLLIGMSGMLDTDSSSHMMLTNLNADGSLNTAFNGTGKRVLNKEYNNEYLTSMIEDQHGNLIVVGHVQDEGDAAIVRKYPTDGSTGVKTWEGLLYSGLGTAAKFFGVAIQKSQRIITFGQTDATHGVICAYTPVGSLDTAGFNVSGVQAGQITTADFGLNYMGPVYACVVDSLDVIYVAYKNMLTGDIDLALIHQNAHGLVSEFAQDGILHNIFGTTIANPQDVRIALDNNGQIVVAAAIGSDFVVKRYFAVYGGAQDTDFGTVTIPVGTQAVINQLTTLNDNTIIITGADNATDDSMIIARITETGDLDTVFNAQGQEPGVLPIKIGNIVPNYNERQATGLVVQAATGNMVVTGYEKQTTNLSVPMVFYVYGQPGTTQVKQSPIESPENAGTLDTTFDIDYERLGDGSLDLSRVDASLVGATRAVYAYRTNSNHQGYLLVGIDNGSDTLIVRLRQNDTSLDTTFGTGGILTLSGVTGLNHISLDAQDKILVVGTQSGLGWAKRLTDSGTVDVAFASLSTLVEINTICQQQSGRYIVAGRNNSTQGVLVAFQDHLVSPHTTLQVDLTFNPLGSIPGHYPIATTVGLYNLIIKYDDSLFVAYSDSTVKIAKITENGAGLDANFGTAGLINVGIAPNAASAIRVGLDINYKVVVAFSVGLNSVSVARYSDNGVVDNTFNSGVVYNFPAGKLGSAGVTLSRLILTDEPFPATDSKIIVMGYNTAGGNGKLFAARLGTAGTLDTAWNTAEPAGTDVAGIITFGVNGGDAGVAASKMYDGNIFINGQIYGAVGAVGTSNKALLVRLFGDDYIDQVEEQPFESPAGTLDQTLDPSDVLSLNDYLSSIDLQNFEAVKLHIYDDGSMLIAFTDDNTSSKIVKLKADRSLDTSFNNGYGGTPGYVTINEEEELRDMYVANGLHDDGAIYVCGGNNDLWIHKISAQGVDLGLNIHDGNQEANRIVKSSNGRLLVSTVNSEDKAVILAFKADGSGRDLSFGNNGQGEYVIGIDDWWLDTLSLDSSDRIYYAYPSGYSYVQGGDVVVERLKVNGTELDPWPAFGTPIQISNVIEYVLTYVDEVNNRLIVAAQDGDDDDNYIRVRRYNLTTGADDGDLVSFTIEDEEITLRDLFLDENQNIYVAGTNRSDDRVVVARITSSMELDVTYAADEDTPGVADIDVDPLMTDVWAAALHPDRRVYVIGYEEDDYNPTMIRLFGDQYATQQSEVTFKAIPGTQDLTLDPNATTPDAGIVLSDIANASLVAGGVARSVYANQDGTTYVAFLHSNEIDLYVGKFNADMGLVSGFGSNNGFTGGLTMPIINNLAVDSLGRALVVGVNGGTQKVLRFELDGSSATEFSSWVDLTHATQIVEQQSGRVLVSGKTPSSGIVIAYKNTGESLDSTYGPYGSNGFYETAVNAQVDDMVIDEFDNAYIVYRDTTVKLQKLTAYGVYDTDFGTINTGIVATHEAHVGINDEGNILVAASSGSSISIGLYNGSNGNVIHAVQNLNAQNTNSPVVTDITSAADNFIVLAYESAGYGVQDILTIRVNAAGDLDTTFNPDGDVPSILAAHPEDAIEMYSVTVQLDGKILMVGKNATNPVLARVYGNSYDKEYVQYPNAELAGTLDYTLSQSTGGVLDIGDVFENLTEVSLNGYVTSKIHTYNNDNFMVMFLNNTNHSIILARFHKDFTLDTSFNEGSGYLVQNLDISTVGQADMFVDSASKILVSFGSSSGSNVYRFNNNGSLSSSAHLPYFNAYGVGQQTPTRTVVAGLYYGEGDNGGLLGLTTTGTLDTTFGDNGAILLPTNQALVSFAIDEDDKVLVTYKNASNKAVLARFNVDGSIDTSFVNPVPIQIENVSSGTNLRVAYDAYGNIIVAAATASGFTVARYNALGGSLIGSQILIVANNPTLSHLYITTNGKAVMTGYETNSPYRIIAARFTYDDGTSNFGLDTSFNPQGNVPGVFAEQYNNQVLTARTATLYNDGRILLGGDNGSHPYMQRIYGDSYDELVQSSPDLGIAGTIDTTYGNDGTLSLSGLFGGEGVDAGFVIDGNALVGKAIMLDSLGRILVTGATSSGRLYLARYTAAGFLDTAFNTGSVNGGPGYVIDQNGNSGNALTVDGSGNILVAGSADGEGDVLYVARYTDSGILDVTFDPINANGIYGQPGYFIDAKAFSARGVGVDSLGNIVVCGDTYWSTGGYIARYTSTNPTYDTTFANGNGYIYDENASHLNGLAIDSNDNIIVTGTNDEVLYIARYIGGNSGSAGVYDNTFNGGYGATPGYFLDAEWGLEGKAVKIDADGKILVTGISGYNGFYLAQFLSTGERDTSFINSFNEGLSGEPGVVVSYDGIYGYGLDIDTNQTSSTYGNIFATGLYGEMGFAHVVQFTSGGEFVGGLLDGFSQSNFGIVIDSNSKLVVTGTTGDELYLARYNDFIYDFVFTPDAYDTTFAGSEGFASIQAHQVIALAQGGYYIALDAGSDDGSQVIKLTSSDSLDSSYGDAGIAGNAPTGVKSMIQDALGRIVIAGTDSSSGWVRRYTTSGDVDSTFNDGDVVQDDSMNTINVIVEQTLARIVVAGQNTSGNGAVQGYTDTGALDITFGVDGQFDAGLETDIYGLVVDLYDRLIIAYKNGSNVDVARLTSNGELDITFGTNNTGIIQSALTNVGAAQESVRVGLNQAGLIIVAASTADGTGVKTAAFDNGTSALNNGQNASGYTVGTLITGLTGAVVNSIVAVVDGYTLIAGYESGNHAMWVARLKSDGTLDTDEFNPEPTGLGVQGIMKFKVLSDVQTNRYFLGMDIRPDGRLAMVGYEILDGTQTAFLTRAYNNPYQVAVDQFPNAKPVGNVDATFGLDADNIVTFYATFDADSDDNQKAKAIALQGLNRFILAFDGREHSESYSRIFINRFNMDGILDTTFNGTGRAVLPANYEDEYVNDMIVFTTPSGVNKAIIAGYASNYALDLDTSLLLQYNLDTASVDTDNFGGYDQDPAGQSCADITKHNSVARQTSGRIITAGSNYNRNGAIVGYTATGKLDRTFGSDGFYLPEISGIYTHAIDTLDRVVFAYIDDSNEVVVSRLLADGSDLDASFNSTGSVATGITNISGSYNVRVAIDASGRIVVAAMNTDNQVLFINRYNSDGSFDNSVNTDNQIPYQFNNASIKKLLVDDNNKIVVVGSDSVGYGINIYVLRLQANMSGFDTSFNEAGYITYTNAAEQRPLDALIHPDGRVVVVGSELEEYLP